VPFDADVRRTQYSRLQRELSPIYKCSPFRGRSGDEGTSYTFLRALYCLSYENLKTQVFFEVYTNKKKRINHPIINIRIINIALLEIVVKLVHGCYSLDMQSHSRLDYKSALKSVRLFSSRTPTMLETQTDCGGMCFSFCNSAISHKIQLA